MRIEVGEKDEGERIETEVFEEEIEAIAEDEGEKDEAPSLGISTKGEDGEEKEMREI